VVVASRSKHGAPPDVEGRIPVLNVVEVFLGVTARVQPDLHRVGPPVPLAVGRVQDAARLVVFTWTSTYRASSYQVTFPGGRAVGGRGARRTLHSRDRFNTGPGYSPEAS